MVENTLNLIRQNKDPSITCLFDLIFGQDLIHENFKLLETRREALNNAVLGLADSKSKDWGSYAEKITEIFKQATHLAIWSWGKNNNKTAPLDLKPKSKINWEQKPMQDLVALLIAKTIGYDLTHFKSAQESLAKMEREVANLKDQSGSLLSNEFAQTFGMPLVEFSAQWKNLQTELIQIREERNEPKVYIQ